MKRLILALLITCSLVACKKDKSQCWVCDFTAVNNNPAHQETICQEENPAISNPTDASGNVLISHCEKK